MLIIGYEVDPRSDRGARSHPACRSPAGGLEEKRIPRVRHEEVRLAALLCRHVCPKRCRNADVSGSTKCSTSTRTLSSAHRDRWYRHVELIVPAPHASPVVIMARCACSIASIRGRLMSSSRLRNHPTSQDTRTLAGRVACRCLTTGQARKIRSSRAMATVLDPRPCSSLNPTHPLALLVVSIGA